MVDQRVTERRAKSPRLQDGKEIVSLTNETSACLRILEKRGAIAALRRRYAT